MKCDDKSNSRFLLNTHCIAVRALEITETCIRFSNCWQIEVQILKKKTSTEINFNPQNNQKATAEKVKEGCVPFQTTK